MNKKSLIEFVIAVLVVGVLVFFGVRSDGPEVTQELQTFDGPAYTYEYPKGWILDGDEVSMNIWSPVAYKAQEDFLAMNIPGEGVLPNAWISCGKTIAEAIAANPDAQAKNITTLREYLEVVYAEQNLDIKKTDVNGEEAYQVIEDGLGKFEVTYTAPRGVLCGFGRLIPGQGFNEYSEADIEATENLFKSIQFKK